MQKPQTKGAAPAAPTPANTAESLGWQLRGALPPMRLHSVSLCDATGDVVWLSEGALGPDEHGFIMEAIDTLGADPSLAYCESDLEDGRGAVFLAVRAPTGDLVGVVMILADIKSLSGGAASRILIAPIRAVLQRMAILLRPANSATQTVPVLGMGRSPAAPVAAVAVTPVQINTPAANPQPSTPPESNTSAASPAPKSATVLEFVPPSEDVLDFNPEEISIAAPSEPERAAAPALSPQAVDDILSFELSDIPIARPVVRPAPIVPVADLPTAQEAPPVADEAPPVVEPPVVREAPPVAREISPPTLEPSPAPREAEPPVVREVPPAAREVSPPTLEPAPAPREAEPPVVRDAPPAAREISPPAPEPASAPPPETAPPAAREIPTVEPVAAPKRPEQPKIATASTAEVVSLREATVTTDTVPDLIEIPTAPEAIASTGTMTVVEQQPPALSEITNEPSIAESVATESTGNAPAPVVDVPTLSAAADSKAAEQPRESEQPNDVLVAPLTRLRAGGRTQRFIVSLRDPANAASARKRGSSVDLDEWQYPEAVIVDEVCSWLAAHAHLRESTPLNLLIRVSAQAIEDTQFTDLIASHLSMNDIPPATIAFMLPESLCVSHRARAEKFVTACEKLGCGIVIDEFTLNSGVVSFLRSKALRMVIVDSKLTTSAMKDKVSQALVIAICQASKVLGIHCTATGVDTSIARRWLTAIGFDFAQGKIFDGPRPIESLANAEAPK